MSVRFVCSGVALLALTACGGGGGGGSSNLPGTNLGDFSAEPSEMVDAFDNFGAIRATGETSAAQLPNGGSAEFGGAIVISPDLYNSGTIITVTGDTIIDNVPGFAPSGYVGEVSLTADFSSTSRTVSGQASNFFATTFNKSTGAAQSFGSSVGGTLNLSSGSVSDAEYAATEVPLDVVSGNIGGLSTTGTIPTTFFANGQGILGEGGGTLTVDGTQNDVILIAQPKN